MARTAVALHEFVDNGSLADPAGVNLNPANGHTVSGAKVEQIVLRVNVTNSGGGNITVESNPDGPGGAGNLVVAIAQNATEWLGPFNSDEHMQPDGSLSVDVGAGMTGTITAFQLDREV